MLTNKVFIIQPLVDRQDTKSQPFPALSEDAASSDPCGPNGTPNLGTVTVIAANSWMPQHRLDLPRKGRISYIPPWAMQDSLTSVNKMAPISYMKEQITCLCHRDKCAYASLVELTGRYSTTLSSWAIIC